MDRVLEPEPPSMPPIVDVAGRSASLTFERRLSRHRAKARARRGEVLLFGAGVIIGGVALAMGGGRIGPTWPFFGMALTFAGSMWVLAELVGVPDDVLNWRRGAVGEEETGRVLGQLSTDFSVLHDRRIPRSRANVDHIVVGPTGVFVIETKRYSGWLTVRGNEVFVAGRRRTKVIQQALWEADVVGRVLLAAGQHQLVRPVLCVHHAKLPWGAMSVSGVSIVSGSRLIEALTNGPAVLEATELIVIREKIARAMPRA